MGMRKLLLDKGRFGQDPRICPFNRIGNAMPLGCKHTIWGMFDSMIGVLIFVSEEQG